MNRFIISLVFYCSSLVPHSAGAEIKIEDPQGVIAQMEKKLALKTIEQLFKLGSHATYEQRVESCEISCTDPEPNSLGGCLSVCKVKPYQTRRSVFSMDSASVVISGDDGFYDSISVDQIEQDQGNLGLRIFRNLNQVFNFSGRLQLTGLTQFQYPLAPNTPQARKVEAFSMRATFTPEGYKSSFDLKITLIPTAPGIAQVAMLSIMNEVYFKLQDY